MKFIADAMLGKLARWMRMMGCDVAYFPEISDQEISAIASRSDRIILTRDTRLTRLKINRGRTFLVCGDHYPDQIRQVVRAFSIDPFSDMLSRCLGCNRLLIPIEKNDIQGLVPSYVFETQYRFKICPDCRKIYWKASHVSHMIEQLDRILDQTDGIR